jgi:predicted RNA-binding Zn-ribbon protein involved in translation (DUF1610 family)
LRQQEMSQPVLESPEDKAVRPTKEGETMKKPVRCTACKFKGVIDVPKGQKVKYTRCPACGQVALR